MPHHNSLPSIDLHRHLDGNVRVSTIIELAKEHSITIPSYDLDELSSTVYIHDKTSDLLAFLTKLDIGVSVLKNAAACKRIAYENVLDAKAEGLHYVELRFSPLYMASAFMLTLNEVVEAVIEGVQEANDKIGYNAKLIGILSRTFGTQACMQELDALLQHSQHIVAIDLAGDEKGYPCHLFVEHFKKVRDAGLHVTIHAGEADGPQSIWDAINLLGATRIGHGVAAHQDIQLMAYLSKNKVGIESCILSNYQTGTWLDIPNHPVRTFLDNGIEAFLNTDDPGVSNNTLASEYALAEHDLQLPRVQIEQLKQNSLQQSFLSPQEKTSLLAQIQAPLTL
jgi:adenosine deaminase